MQVIRQIVPVALQKCYDGTNGRRFITIHETANTSVGADAQAHANLQSRGNTRQASWHETVDDHEVIQSYEHTAQTWNAGDGHGDGNLNSISIEICVNSDGDFVKAVSNAAERVRQLMKMYGIQVSHVVQHNHWSGKNCPTFLRRGDHGVTWNQFLAMLTTEEASNVPPTTKPPTPTNPPPPIPSGGFDMTKLPSLDWRAHAPQFDPMTERVQSLLAAAECYPKTALIDGRRGPVSLDGLARFQVRYNCGDGHGHADLKIGPNTWESLLTGKKW